MKATQTNFTATAARAAAQCRVFFFCGPDEAGAAAAAQKITSLLADPGERIDLSGADLKREPALLGDEARSRSLFGGNRHIYVRSSGDETHDSVANLIDGTGDACPVLIVATSATDKSRTAKLLDKRADALVAVFYPPDLRSLTASVREIADGAGLRLNGDIAERIARASGMDVRLARSEVEKLALYLDASPAAPKQADGEALLAIGAKTEEDGFMPLVNAALSGDTARLPGELNRMRELGLNPVGVLLAVERRAAQLAQISARMGAGGSVAAAIDNESSARRIFWKDKGDISRQMTAWHGPQMGRLVSRLVELHRTLLANSAAGEMLLAQGLTTIARAAATRSRRR